ncbi:MAG: cysteine--tRNA ligase [Tenericutes bacterium HGW-Tenericutes-4]|nr:MAG: cysteine--tRNA ligase [Tenericutes bacterium HGW-Tenericutes-4]
MEKTPLKLYNTISKKVEIFSPLTINEVKMYTCGPTVYSTAHIGNFRAYVFMDTLRRILKHNEFNLISVMNITDVGHLTDDEDNGEDKMELAAKKEHKTPYEIAKMYTERFFEDAKKMNINFEDVIIAKATDHIADMIAFIKGIQKNGYAYEVDGNVYFDVEKYNKDFNNKYGELSGINLDNQLAGARIELNLDKKSPHDFALWIKAPKEHIMKWKSPWGVGYPGWHIECSAMSTKYLGERFDIHTGGVDHIPVHHENEIAQSRGLTCDHNHTQATFWLHCEFLKVDNGKMSKSLGNVYTISDLENKGFSALDYRYFLLNANFRTPQNFTWEALESAKVSRRNLLELLVKHKQSTSNNFTKTPFGNSVAKQNAMQFFEEINYDLNLPIALGIFWDMIKLEPQNVVYEVALQMDEILGLKLKEEVEQVENELKNKQSIPDHIKALAEVRFNKKQNKNFADSDRLRDELKILGYTIKDTKDSYEITKD